MPTKVHPIRVVLRLPKPAPALLIHANAILTAMAADVKQFPSPSPALVLVTSHLSTLNTCETAAKTRAVGAVAARDAAAKLVIVDLVGLAAYVEQICNADPSNAAALATAACMYLRKPSTHSKLPMKVKQPVTGTVHVLAKAVKGAKAYDWQYSVDGGKTWVNAPSGTKANITITGMQTNVTTQFRMRAITKAGAQDWAEPFSSLVL